MDVPPKLIHRSIGLPVPKGDRGAPARAVGEETALDRLRRVEPGMPGEGLPVLGAIQQFVDLQRRRVRRTMLAMTVLFLIVMAAGIAGAAFAGRMYFSRLRTDMNAARLEDAKETEAKLEKMRADASASLETAIEQSRNDSLTMQAAYSAGVVAVRTDAFDLIASVSNRVKDHISEIEINNAFLANDVDARYAALTNLLEVLIQQNAELKGEIADLQKKSLTGLEYDAPDGTSFLLMTTNTRRVIKWRLPLPGL